MARKLVQLTARARQIEAYDQLRSELKACTNKAREIKMIEEDRITINCHTFLDDICTKTGGLPRAEISRLREEVGAEVRAEQVERERRRREDGSGMRDG